MKPSWTPEKVQVEFCNFSNGIKRVCYDFALGFGKRFCQSRICFQQLTTAFDVSLFQNCIFLLKILSKEKTQTQVSDDVGVFWVGHFGRSCRHPTALKLAAEHLEMPRHAEEHAILGVPCSHLNCILNKAILCAHFVFHHQIWTT